MDREIHVQYTPELLRVDAWSFWRRYVGWGGFIAAILTLVSFLYLVSTGERSWLTVLLGMIAGLAALMLGGGYIGILKRSSDQLRKMSSPIVQFRFTDAALYTRSDLGAAEIPWHGIDGLWKFSKVWLLMITKVNYITLPTEVLDDELRQFIAAKTER